MRKNSRKSVGTVLIEILIIVAMIGIILAILLPNLIDGIYKAKQKRTVADIHAIAIAMMSYYTDMEGAAAAGAVVHIGTYDKINHKNLAELLVPQYLEYLPFKDAWGHPFDYYFRDWCGYRGIGRQRG